MFRAFVKPKFSVDHRLNTHPPSFQVSGKSLICMKRETRRRFTQGKRLHQTFGRRSRPSPIPSAIIPYNPALENCPAYRCSAGMQISVSLRSCEKLGYAFSTSKGEDRERLHELALLTETFSDKNTSACDDSHFGRLFVVRGRDFSVLLRTFFH